MGARQQVGAMMQVDASKGTSGCKQSYKGEQLRVQMGVSGCKQVQARVQVCASKGMTRHESVKARVQANKLMCKQCHKWA